MYAFYSRWSAVGLVLCLASSVLAQSGRATEASDQVATVTVTPPSIVEDNSVVTQRMLDNPIQEVWSYRTLKRDNRLPPELIGATVNVLEDDAGGSGEGGISALGRSWDAGGSAVIFPPDTILAVGPTQVLTATNAQFRIWSKNGTSEFTGSWSSFFSGLGASFSFTSDPVVNYDHESGRWFLSILGIRNSDFWSWYLIAVSDDSNPNGTWKKYAIDSTLNGGAASPNWSDYPRQGVSNEALFISSNMFSRSSFAFAYCKVRVIPKQQLLDFASSITYSDIWSITDPAGGTSFTIVPAQHWGTPQAPFLVDSDPSTRVVVFGVNNPLGSPTLTKKDATVTSMSTPSNAVQKDSTVRLDTIDTRVFNAVFRNNQLWFGHNTGQSGEAGCRWYAVNTSNWPTSISVAQSGTVFLDGTYQWFPSLAVNSAGATAMGFSRSSSAEYPSIYYTFRNTGDANGTMQVPTLIKAGTHIYTGEGGSPIRYGDYTGTVVDPADDTTFWHANEFPGNTNAQWRIWVQEFTTGASPTLHDVSIDAPGMFLLPITVTPNDHNGNGNGNTPFVRTYVEGTSITLTAPASQSGLFFREWQLDGVGQGSNTALNFSVLADVAADAIYERRYDLTVSSAPTSGALIDVSLADNGGQSDGTTPFVRTYDSGDSVTMIAPATHDGRTFDKWIVDGADQPQGQTTVVISMLSDKTATANYVDATCEPCDTNCDGSVNGFDVDDMVALLSGSGSPCSPCAGDANADGSVNGFDVDPFVACLSGP
ncbi:MAG: hypothetical protein CHACPFDD_03525 [Phycisphaerae bacterium]|nr:hypothetical protein [Phycisphaerae bacterium]